jgi:hypothetical protein
MASVADDPGPLGGVTLEDGSGYVKPGRVGRGTEAELPVVIGWEMADDGVAELPVVIGCEMADDGVGGTIATELSTVVPGMRLIDIYPDAEGAGTTAEELDAVTSTAEEPGAVGRAELVTGGKE